MIFSACTAAAITNTTNIYADQISVTAEQRVCTFQDKGSAKAGSITFTGANFPGKEVSLSDNGLHNLNVNCNYDWGYSVSAVATNLIDEDINETIAYSPDYVPRGTDGVWTAQLTGAVKQSAAISTTSSVVKTSDNPTTEDGEDFGVKYKVYLGTETAPGTYTGSATFTLAVAPLPLAIPMILRVRPPPPGFLSLFLIFVI